MRRLLTPARYCAAQENDICFMLCHKICHNRRQLEVQSYFYSLTLIFKTWSDIYWSKYYDRHAEHSKKTPEDSLLRQGIVQLRRMTSRDGQFPSVAGSSNRTNSFQYQMHFLVSCLGCNKVRAIEFKAKKNYGKVH